MTTDRTRYISAKRYARKGMKANELAVSFRCCPFVTHSFISYAQEQGYVHTVGLVGWIRSTYKKVHRIPDFNSSSRFVVAGVWATLGS